MNRLSSWTLTAAFLAFSAPLSSAYAQNEPTVSSQAPAPSFGKAGQVVVNMGYLFQLQKQSFSVGGSESTTLGGSLPVGVFITDSLLISLTPTYSVSKYNPGQANDEASTTKTLSLAPTVGWNVRLDERFSLLPTAMVGYGRSWQSGARGDESASSYSASVSLPLLFHPGRHMFIGMGPSLSFYGTKQGGIEGASVWLLPVTFTLGGWI